MQVTENIRRGARIELHDLPELVQMAIDRQPVVVEMNNKHLVVSAAFMTHWSLRSLSETKIYHALRTTDETESDQ